MPIPRRKLALLGLAASLVATLTSSAHAQMHHVDAPERVTRAIGVYEWTGDLSKPSAARFVPVSLYINGHFEDAGLYLARPIPFALEPGDIYSLEHAGEPEGLLDLDLAKRVVTGNALADDNPEGAWYAFGRFTPQTAPRTPVLHASHHLPTIQSSAGPNTPAGTKPSTAADDDSRPHMTRRDTSTPAANTGAGTAGSTQNTAKDTGADDSKTNTSASTTTTASTAKTDDSDDLDRPTLRRRDPSQDAARRREYGKKGTQSSVTAAGPALGDDPDRPILGRGKAEDQGTPELNGLPADMHQAVAVSDATHREDHPFARDWDNPTERAATLAAMAALARPRLAAYLATNNLVPSAAPLTNAAATGQATSPAPTPNPGSGSDTGAPPKLQRGVPRQYQTQSSSAPQAHAPTAPATSPTSKAAATHKTPRTAKPPAPHAAPLTLAQETVAGFTLSYGGLPTFVYTAAAAAAPAHEPEMPTAAANPVAYVTVVAQRLPSGELQVALSSVTDSAHLDRTPRLRLIDAVDPDDSHRASLLFEMRGHSSRQFALYRLTSAQAEQTFTTASIE